MLGCRHVQEFDKPRSAGPRDSRVVPSWVRTTFGSDSLFKEILSQAHQDGILSQYSKKRIEGVTGRSYAATNPWMERKNRIEGVTGRTGSYAATNRIEGVTGRNEMGGLTKQTANEHL